MPQRMQHDRQNADGSVPPRRLRPGVCPRSFTVLTGLLLAAEAGAAPAASEAPSGPFGMALPEVAGIPLPMLLLWLVFVVASWWIVYLLFAGLTRRGEQEEERPAVAADGLPQEGRAPAEDPGREEEVATGTATPAHWGEDFAAASETAGTEPQPDGESAGVPLGGLAVLDKLETRFIGCPDMESALAEAVAALIEDLGCPGAAAWTGGPAESAATTEEIGEFAPQACRQSGLWDEECEGGRVGDVFRPWADALAAGEAVCIPDCAAEPDLCARLRPGVGSLVLVPFPREAGTRGAVALAWPEALEVGELRFAMARRVGAVVGLAVDRVRLRQELVVRRTQARVLVETGSALSCAQDLGSPLDAILHVVHDRYGYRACALMLVDEDKQELYVANMAGYDPAVRTLRIPVGSDSVTATAARRQRVVNVPEVSEWPGYVAGSPSVRSELALPLVVDGRTVGVLDVESDQPAAFDVRDRITLEAVASQAALVLAHARLVAELRERAARLQAVDEMARAVSTTLDARSLFQIVVEQVRAIVGCDRAVLATFDEEAGEATLAAVSSARPVAGLEIGAREPLAAMQEQKRVPRATTYVPDVEASTAGPSRLRGTGFRSVVRVPILVDGDPVGVLTASSLRPDAFSHTEVATLEAVAPHVSAALRNARLYEQLERSYQRLNEAHVQLVQSEQLRVLGEMASGVAHNFNNVLGAILGRAQLVRTRLQDAPLAQEMAVIEQAATDGAATVRRLQEFTQVRTDHEFVPLDLSQLARDALALTRPWWKDRAESSGVRYEITTDLRDGAWVEGQAHELREVVMNVLINAIEAMPDGGSLTLRGRVAGGMMALEVTDTGTGMSEEVRSRIFHPFYSTKGPRGTGLGLSIAYGIVRRHGGELEVESSVGQGTTVRLLLPAGSRHAAPVAAAPALVAAAFQAKVLVVEDEPAIASLLEELLEDVGYGVVTARTGREAVERLFDDAFQLVLTDLGMPEMSGWELARHCRDLYPGLPVVLVTGWGVELDKELVEETGVRGVVSKPFTVTQILGTVARVLEETGPPEEERKLAA